MFYRRIFLSKIKDRITRVDTVHFSKENSTVSLKVEDLILPQSQKLSESRTKLSPPSSEKPQELLAFGASTTPLLLMYFQKNAPALNLPICKRAQTGHPTKSRLAEQFICNTIPESNMKVKKEQNHS